MDVKEQRENPVEERQNGLVPGILVGGAPAFAAALLLAYHYGVRPLREQVVQQERQILQERRRAEDALAQQQRENQRLRALLTQAQKSLRTDATVEKENRMLKATLKGRRAGEALAALSLEEREELEMSNETHAPRFSDLNPTGLTPPDSLAPLPLSPVATGVTTDRPTLRWKPVSGVTRYRVSLARYDKGNVSRPKSPPIVPDKEVAGTVYIILKPLEHERIYQWTVKAMNGDKPGAPGVARFYVLAKQKAEILARVQARQNKQRLEMGTLCREVGLFQDAEQEWRAISPDSPEYKRAQELLKTLEKDVETP